MPDNPKGFIFAISAKTLGELSQKVQEDLAGERLQFLSLSLVHVSESTSPYQAILIAREPTEIVIEEVVSLR